ncbi:hypothetical protein AGMMS50268_00890 [Spirochaetia bacterium]|nr:hypothetical protein AGMMS50268_00890 [Spirochaetia bacterium]
MKKLIAVCGLLAFLTAAGFTQTMDNRVEEAVDALVAQVNRHVEVSVEPITVGNTGSVSAFSAFLGAKVARFAANNPFVTIVAPTRGLSLVRGNSDWVRLGGSFMQTGADVAVTLAFFADGNRQIASHGFTVPLAEIEALHITILPENRDSVAELDSTDVHINNNPFTITAWCNSDSRTYYEGDRITISLEADANCFFKVYQIDVNNKVQVIYPNSADRNNTLKEKKIRTIPEKTAFVLGAPFGEETIVVVASKKQFDSVTDQTIPTANVAATKFTYTILPTTVVEETLEYRLPSDIHAAVRALKKTVEDEGGTFSGDNQKGAFSVGNFNGVYSVTGGKFAVTMMHPAEQNVSEVVPGTTRGAGGGYSFSFSKPSNLSGAVGQVRNGITKSGGTFNGDETGGEFAASGISGRYAVSGSVNVTILAKPFVIPNSLIEKEVKGFFGVK